MKRFLIPAAISLILAGCAGSAKVDLSVNDIEQITDGAKITVHNGGTEDAEKFTLFIELQKGGKTVGEFNKSVSGVPAGGDKVVETSFSGTEYDLIYVKADSKNVVAESDEGNNEFGG